MRIHEILEDISRRGLLKGVVGGAAVAATGASQAGPYVDQFEMTSDQRKFFDAQIPKLQDRARSILRNLRVTLAEVDPKNYNKIDGVTLEVSYQNQIAQANFRDKKIYIDVTVYHDMNDDTLAATIGHELGHFVYGTSRYHGDSHSMERDADLYGVRLAQKGGYDIRQALRGIWEAGEFFRKGSKTHPTFDQRLSGVRSGGFPTVGTIYLNPAKHQVAVNQLRSTAQAIQTATHTTK